MAFENLARLGIYPRARCAGCDKLGSCNVEIGNQFATVEEAGGQVEVVDFGIEISREGGVDEAFQRQAMIAAGKISLMGMAAYTLAQSCAGGLYLPDETFMCLSPSVRNNDGQRVGI